MSDDILKRIAAAIDQGAAVSALSADELIEAVTILVKCGEYGYQPKDILLNGLYDYPEMLTRLDTLHFPDVDNAFYRSGLDRDGSDLPKTDIDAGLPLFTRVDQLVQTACKKVGFGGIVRWHVSEEALRAFEESLQYIKIVDLEMSTGGKFSGNLGTMNSIIPANVFYDAELPPYTAELRQRDGDKKCRLDVRWLAFPMPPAP